MDSVLTLLDLDNMSKSGTPLTMGEQIILSGNQCKEYIKTLFNETSSSSMMDVVCSCECGALSGNFYKGATCDDCDSECTDAFVDDISFKGWLTIPDDLALPKVLHPIAYQVLHGWLKGTLVALLDPKADMPQKYAGVFPQQGYTHFYKNFDNIMEFLLTHHNKQVEAEHIRQFLKENRDNIFVSNLPVLNSSLHVITEEATNKTYDVSATYAMKSLITLSDMVFAIRNKTIDHKYVDRCLAEFTNSYMLYVSMIRDKRLIGKFGYIRKMIFGSRLSCTMRAVIINITDNHEADEVYAPWRATVVAHKLEIMNLLTRRFNYKLNDALTIYNLALVQYNETVDTILQTLIEENGGQLWLLCNRPPTMLLGATQLFRVTRVKTDVGDDTLSISTNNLRAPNAERIGSYSGNTVMKFILIAGTG